MAHKLPIIEIASGDISLMSLVEYPAVEMDFLCFKAAGKEDAHKEKAQRFATDKAWMYFSEEQRIITGVAMLADTPIYRCNPFSGEYFVTFPRKLIAQMANDFMRHANDTNLEHAERTYGLHVVESYIVTETTHNDLFSDVPLGSWIISYKVDDAALWERIKKGEFKGFSIEGWFENGEQVGEQEYAAQQQPTEPQKNEEDIINNIFNNHKIMAKISKFMAGIFKSLAKFADVTTDKGVLSFEGELAVGTEVMTTNEDGEMIPAPDGEYVTDDLTIKVEGGKVTEINEKAKPADPPAGPAAMADEDAKRLEATIVELANALEAANTKIADLESRIAAIEGKLGEVDPNNQFNHQDPAHKPAWQRI